MTNKRTWYVVLTIKQWGDICDEHGRPIRLAGDGAPVGWIPVFASAEDARRFANEAGQAATVLAVEG